MSHQTSDPAGARELLQGEEPWILVDVRTVEEFEEGHVPGAYNVPFGFKGPMGLEPNPRFLEVMQRLFASDARLVLA